jgi:O-antigen/teichoic acid export membrane protein
LSRVIGAGTILILIRGLDKADYAAYTALISFSSLCVSLIGNGINIALVRFSAEHLSKTGRRPLLLYILALSLEVVVFLLVTLVAVTSPVQMATFVLGKQSFSSVVPTATLFGLGSLLLQMGRSILQAEERFNAYVVTLWIKQVSVLVVVLGLWLSQMLFFRTLAWGLTLLQLVIGVIVVFKGVVNIEVDSFRKKIENESVLIRHFFSASGWLILYNIILSAFSRMDVLMLSRFSSDAELANYGVAFQYYSLSLLMLGSISAVLRPKFSHVNMQEPARQWKFLTKWLRYSVWIGGPLLLFAVFGRPLFMFINGSQYSESFGIFVVLSLGVWVSLMFSPLVNILVSRKEFNHLLKLAVFAFITSLLGNRLLVPYLGGVGAALGTIFPHILINIGAFVRILQEMKASGYDIDTFDFIGK